MFRDQPSGPRLFGEAVISHIAPRDRVKQAGERAAGMTFVRGGRRLALGLSYLAGVAYGVGVTEIPAAVAAGLARLRAENARLRPAAAPGRAG